MPGDDGVVGLTAQLLRALNGMGWELNDQDISKLFGVSRGK